MGGGADSHPSIVQLCFVFFFLCLFFLSSRLIIPVVLLVVMIYKREQTTQWVEDGNSGVGAAERNQQLGCLIPQSPRPYAICKVSVSVCGCMRVCASVCVCVYIYSIMLRIFRNHPELHHIKAAVTPIFFQHYFRTVFCFCHVTQWMRVLSKANKRHCVCPYA